METNYIEEDLYCPRCGNRISKCNPEEFYWQYPFECNYCDENFFKVECLNYDELKSIFKGRSEKICYTQPQ